MKLKISDIFIINQGHQITDEEIYNGNGNIPIFTSSNKIKGFGNFSIIDESLLPCLTYQTKGYSGVISLQEKPFDANNTAVLILKDEYRNKVNLKYLALIIQTKLNEILTSESGVSYLNKDLVLNVEFELPINSEKNIDIEFQNKFVSKYEKIKKYKEIIIEKINSIENITKSEIIIDKFIIKNMEKIAILNKGSSKVSEENIYKNYDSKGIPVYSSATFNEGLMGRVSKEYYESFDKQGKEGELTWTTNGYAGVVFYRETNYLYSEKCGRIILRKEFKKKINPKFLKIYLNQITYKYKTSESNNGKLDIIHMLNVPVKLPTDKDGNIDLGIQDSIVKKYQDLDDLKNRLVSILKKCNNIINND
jgi:hypothetical protein